MEKSSSKKLVENVNLRLLVLSSAKELGDLIDLHLLEKYHLNKEEYTFQLPIIEDYFEDGHMKVSIDSTVRNMDVYVLGDIGNYSITYTMHQFKNHMSPNDHIMQIKDAIGACNSHAFAINVIMPLLYNSRQHRRNAREDLSCGRTLHELEGNHLIKRIITTDAHDPGVEHSLHNTEFDNVLPYNIILNDLIDNTDVEDLENLVLIAPDNGATGRRNVVLNSLNSEQVNMDAGSFYKQRDYNRVVNGINPIISHDYSGNSDLRGKTAIIVDDMISSGGSMFDCMKELKKLGAEKIFVVTTFDLFTRGITEFDEYYEKGMFDKIYTTNLVYLPEEYKQRQWIHVSDCSPLLADTTYNIHNNLSIHSILRDRTAPMKKLEKKFNDSKKQ